ncbi:MAG: hypothetical protein PHH98_00135 [Candidatus Gracilibacteria bacterium]|nr:hypothetical protein [Candidatus Gracilibacteria bacterium]
MEKDEIISNLDPNNPENNIENRVKTIIDCILEKEDLLIKKRILKKFISFINTLKDNGAISPNCIETLPLSIFNNDEITIILLEIFEEVAEKGDIRSYIMLVHEFRVIFTNIDFIYDSPIIQKALKKSIEEMQGYNQNTSILESFLKT